MTPVRKLATVEPPASAPGPVDPNDPNKRQFGEQAERNGRRLTARPLKQAGDWVTFELVVKATDGPSGEGSSFTSTRHSTSRS